MTTANDQEPDRSLLARLNRARRGRLEPAELDALRRELIARPAARRAWLRDAAFERHLRLLVAERSAS